MQEPTETIVATLRAENPPHCERVDFGELVVVINRYDTTTLVDVVANAGWRVESLSVVGTYEVVEDGRSTTVHRCD